MGRVNETVSWWSDPSCVLNRRPGDADPCCQIADIVRKTADGDEFMFRKMPDEVIGYPFLPDGEGKCEYVFLGQMRVRLGIQRTTSDIN